MSKEQAQPGRRVRVESVYAPTYRTPGLTLNGVVLHLTPTRTLALIRFDDAVQNYIRIEDLIEA